MAKSEQPSDPRPTNPAAPADRARLEQIQQTDINENRLNEDFIDWLKTKGLNYAAVLLLALVAIMGWNLFKERRATERDQAWSDLVGASLPGSLEDVARRHRGTDAIAPWALLDAGERYFSAVQRGVRFFDREPDAEDYRLTPELREEWRGEAERLFREVEAYARAGRGDGRRGFLIASLWGLAAIAESRGEGDDARTILREIISLTSESHPPIAELAETRIESLDAIIALADLPRRADLPEPEASTPIVDPIVTDDLLRDLLTPSGGSGRAADDNDGE